MIRLATKEDISAILVCLEDARSFLKQSGSTQWNGPLGYPNESVYLKDIENQECFVCERNGLVCGVAAFKGHDKEYDKPFGAWLLDTKNYTTIHRIAVCNQARSQGVATELMRYAEEYTKTQGRVSIRIDTHPENLIMQTMLRSLGYTNCGYVVYSYIPIEPKRLIFEKII